jgi:hypothetical protein
MGDPVVDGGNYYRAIVDIPSATALITNTAYWEPMSNSVTVYLGGILQTAGYSLTDEKPVTVTFTTAPASGVEVTIAVLRGVTWYAPGVETASNGNPLQITETQAARFLRGI